MGDRPHRGCAVRDLCFLYGSAPPATQGWKGRAALQRKHGAIPAGFCRFRNDERNMASTSRGLWRAVETCAEQVLRPPAEIQARIRRCRVFGCRDLKVCPRADQE